MTTYDPRVIRQSVQTADLNLSKDYAYGVGDGGMWYDVVTHSDPLPTWGLRVRDLHLRQLSYTLGNSLWQGAVAALIKKVQATPWEVKGKRNVEYYQDVLQYADMGNGWESFIGKLLWDFVHQDFGGVVEIVGGGKADRALTGKVIAVNVLDSLSCVATPVNEYPVVYWNEEDGSMHRMHTSRVWRWADLSTPYRRGYGNGFCALSRYAQEAFVDVFLNRHDYEMLSDLPPSGILALSGITEKQWTNIKRSYEADRQAVGASIWHKTLVLNSLDPEKPVDAKTIPFSTVPEGFSQKEFIDLHVNKLALALGVDPQDIWPLTGQGLGTGTQSIILAQKGQGKMFGYILQMLTRFVNWTVLPPYLEFQFKHQDADGDKQKAEQASLWAGIATSLKSSGLIDDETALQLLANNVAEFGDVLMDSDGQIRLPSSDPKEGSDDVLIADDETPIDPNVTPPTAETTADNQTPNTDTVPRQRGTTDDGTANRTLRFASYIDAHMGRRGNAYRDVKAYTDTRDEYTRNVELIMQDAAEGTVSKASFGIRMRSALNTYGRAAYLDGLAAGGVEVESYADLPTDEKETIAGLLAANSSYVSDAANKIFGADGVFIGTPDMRAAMWSNKSLQEFYDAGVLSADANGMYIWKYGDTEHCDDCRRLNGQKHRYKEWHAHIMPKSSALKCGGYNCKCELEKTTGRAKGGY
jgi:hypothetical protein